MRDFKKEVKWGVILARKFDVAPDDIDIFPFLDSLERAVQCKSNGIKEFNLGQGDSLVISPQGEREEEVLCGKIAPQIISMIMGCEDPFGEWIYDLMKRESVAGPYNEPQEMSQEEIDRLLQQHQEEDDDVWDDDW